MFGLKDHELNIINEILKKYFPSSEIWIFGSRSTSNYKPYSDIDIAIIGNNKFEISNLPLALEAFSESDLPIKADIVAYSEAQTGLKKAIDSQHIKLTLY